MTALDRAEYARLYGPTTGDRVRLSPEHLLARLGVVGEDTNTSESHV
ncbi:MAG TPA: hypothetical protein VGH76_05170 [Actinomycetospora sp.]